MRTLKFKGQLTNAFFATVNQMFGGSSQLPTLLTELGSTMWFDYYALDSSRKLGGAAEHLIDGSEKRICRLTFEFKSPHVIERRSKAYQDAANQPPKWVCERWNNNNDIKCKEKYRLGKISESQMGFEATTLRDLVGCSYHWATGDSMVSQGQLEPHRAATQPSTD